MRRSTRFQLASALPASALPLERVQPGDIGVAHSAGAIGFLIRFFTHSRWNHAFVVVAVHGPTPPQIEVVQAEAHGVMRTTLDQVAPGGSFAILACPSGVARELVVDEALALIRTKYAFTSVISTFFNLLPLPIRLDVRTQSTLICSAVCALALFNGGWERQWPDLYQVTPAELAVALLAPTAN